MNTKIQCIAFYTIVRRELVRMLRISSQVFLPPVITTALYFIIFGALIGKRIGQIDGVHYIEFIAPGLIMMAVITNAYSNVSSSLYSLRFQRSIEEILVSPVGHGTLLLGYILGGILRGVIVALLVFIVSCFFMPVHIAHPLWAFFVVMMVSSVFSLAGFTNAMLARNFDDVMLIPTFVLTPLTYLGGVFYTTHMLPPFWKVVSQFNPILYMVNALRHAMIGFEEVSFSLSLLIMSVLLIVMVMINLVMLKKGIGLRE